MKLKFLLLAFVLSPTFVFADELTCERAQAAVNPRGDCMVFSTSCQVPDDWKRVPSCDLVERVRTSDTSNTVDRRFGVNYWDQLRQKRRENLAEKMSSRSQYGRIGRRGAIESVKALNEDKPLESDVASGEKRKNTFEKRLSVLEDGIPEFLRDQPQYKGSVKNETELTAPEKLERQRARWGNRRPPLERATEMDRESEFSSMPRWDVQQNEHFSEPRYGGDSPYWKPNRPDRKVKKTQRTRRVITNRRGFVGERRSGSLDEQY